MQLTIDIPSNSLGDKIIQILNAFKSDGIKIKEKDVFQKYKNFDYSDDYIEKNWKEILMKTQSDSDYYKSELYYEERGEYLMEKYK